MLILESNKKQLLSIMFEVKTPHQLHLPTPGPRTQKNQAQKTELNEKIKKLEAQTCSACIVLIVLGLRSWKPLVF